ncbi:hypothetical protein, partial [Halobacillus sp. BAB-2008]|uniref:hypothetical protein n=1 Tax=Halobacillus sp. BAB-2008 TaxID=1246484 RepID=UPI0019D3AE3C
KVLNFQYFVITLHDMKRISIIHSVKSLSGRVVYFVKRWDLTIWKEGGTEKFDDKDREKRKPSRISVFVLEPALCQHFTFGVEV